MVDPAAARMGIEPTIALSAGYGSHPITEAFSLSAHNTAFPFVRRIAVDPEAKAGHDHAGGGGGERLGETGEE